MAVPPSGVEGIVCAACGKRLPQHSSTCPYRRSFADAFDATATVAAPLLAGFSLTLIGVVAQAPTAFRWPDTALLLLTVTVLLLVMSVQSGFWARRYRAEPSGRELPVVERTARQWMAVGRASYDGGLVALMLGLASVLAPPAGGTVRWVAAAIMAAAALGEVIWATVARLRLHPPV
jgi:hypothetical protein